MTSEEVRELSDEELRIRVAELCGYERKPQHDAVWIRGGLKYFTVVNLPNYPSDLNAMHEAEKSALFNQNDDWLKYDRYRIALEEMMGQEDTWHANARQRAEAFVLTLSE